MISSTLIKSIQDVMRQDQGVDGDAQRLSQLVWMIFLKILDDTEQELELMTDGYVPAIPAQYQWRAWARDEEGLTGEGLNDFVNNDLFPALRKLSGGTNPRTMIVREAFEDSYNYMKSGTLLRQVINKINSIDFTVRADRHQFNDLYEKLLKDLQSAGNAGEYYTPRALTQFIVEMVRPQLGEVVLDPACGTGGFLANTIDHLRGQVKTPDDEALLQASLRGIEKKQLPHLLCLTNMILHGIDAPTAIRRANTLTRPLRDYGPADRVDVIVTNPPFGGVEEPGVEQNFPQKFRTRETADLFLVLIMRLLKPGGRAGVVLPDGTLFGERGVKTRVKEQLLEECNLHTIVRLPNSVFAPYTTIATNLLFFTKGEPTSEVWYYEHRLPLGVKAYNKTSPIRIEEFDDIREWWGNRVENDHAWRVSIDELKDRGYDLNIHHPTSRITETVRAASVLTDHRSDQHRIDEISESLGELLREMVTGADESDQCVVADNLPEIARISGGADYAWKVVISAALRGQTSHTAGSPSDLVGEGIPIEESGPWDLPETWNWVNLAHLSESVLGKMLDKAKNKGEYRPYLRNTNVRWFGFDLDDLKEMRFEDREFDRYGLLPGDVIVCEGGEPGRAAVWTRDDIDMRIQKALHRIRCNHLLRPEWLVYVLRGFADDGTLKSFFTGIGIKHLTGASLKKIPIPLPPVGEQDQILAMLENVKAGVAELKGALDSQTRLN
ncbi:N-6 DNA methylase [Streptomyces sp. NPDC006552]|uniref:N-6 DNA methylase n=1 Tax=Streptomyces sp. NPDC006552 TaxID=3157179 RepID=UPI0033BA68FB